MTKIKVVREKIEVRYNKNQGGQEKKLKQRYDTNQDCQEKIKNDIDI